MKYDGQEYELLLIVVEGDGPNLFGRNWLRSIKLNWGSIKLVKSQLDSLLQQYAAVFKEELGTLTGFQAKLELKQDAQPKFSKARSVPYALKEPIKEELQRLENLGVIEKVSFSEWASPVVPVPKVNNHVRLCGDYKINLNPGLYVDQYPMPTPEDLMATLAGGQLFSKLDLSSAYLQVPLHPESHKYITINTHRGLYQYTRLPFGVASAPAIFQRIMEGILQGILGVVVYIDDILVSGKDEQEHLKRLEQVYFAWKIGG